MAEQQVPEVDESKAGAFEPSVRGSWTVTPIALAAAVVGVVVAVGLGLVLPGRLAITGIAEAAEWVQASVSGLRVLRDLAAALTIGWLFAATFLVPPQPNWVLDVGGYRAVRAAGLSAVVWAAVSFALIPITAADQYPDFGSSVLSADVMLKMLSSDESVRALLTSGLFVLVVAVMAWFVLRPGWSAVLLVLSVVSLLPIASGGHASGSADHDIAVDTMIYHLVGASLWVGGLVAFLGLARQRIATLDVVARRFSATALVAFVLVGLSGFGNAWVRLENTADLWTTPYGRLILVKLVLLIVLGGFGLYHRRRTVPDVVAGRRGALIRLASVEALVMAGTMGVAVALSRTAPPLPSGIVPSILENTLGYDLDGPPTFVKFLTDWRFDWLLGTLAVVGIALYLRAVLKLRRRGDSWPVGRTIAWVLGCLAVLLATSSGLGRYASAQFSVHMLAHMILGMFAPILLALGGPTTLALRVLPAARRGTAPGGREALVAFLNSRFVRVISHPIFVFLLFIGSFYAIYMTDLFPWLMGSHLGHVAMNLHFLLVGYLYYWVIIGIDPTPRRWPHLLKLAMLLGALPFHAFFGITLMSSRVATAEPYYRGLALPWVENLVDDQKTGGAIAWAVTEAPMLVVLVALLYQWSHTEARQNKQADRHKDRYGDPELDDYNAMLAALAARDANPADAQLRRPRPTGLRPEQTEQPERTQPRD